MILNCRSLHPANLETGTYTTDTVKLARLCTFYLMHSDTKCLQELTFYVASNNGSVLLSCATMLALGLIQPHTRLDYLPPRGSFITSSADHPMRKKSKWMYMHPEKNVQCLECLTNKIYYPSLLQQRTDVFDGIGCFPGPPYHIQVDPSVTPKQCTCWYFEACTQLHID